MRALTSPQAAGITLCATGATVWAGAFVIGSPDCERLGTLLCILGALVITCWRVTSAVREVNRPADEAYRDGFDAGYDKGWREGRASSLPKVVGLRRAQ